jgi:glycosyltransferase involved in cell wall biosynthesis
VAKTGSVGFYIKQARKGIMEIEKNISVIVVAKNEEIKIKDCLDSAAWVDEVILIDTGSTDATKDIAKKLGVIVYDFKGKGSFSDWRNEGLKRANSKWVLYLDADERITPDLRNEIQQLIRKESRSDWYIIPRSNVIFGRVMKHGGWWPDYVKRLFKKEALKGWKYDLHEEPEVMGIMGKLTHPMIHIKEDNISDMIGKTNIRSEVEAKLLYDSGHPPMTWWRFPRIMLTEFWYRYIILRGFMDGVEGTIFSIYQVWSKFVTYAKLWEIQQKKA